MKPKARVQEQESSTRIKAALTAIPLIRKTTNLPHRTALWTSALLTLSSTLKIINLKTETLCYLYLYVLQNIAYDKYTLS